MRLRVLFVASLVALLCSALVRADANTTWSLHSPFLKATTASNFVSNNAVASRISFPQPNMAYRSVTLVAQQPGEKDIKVDIKVDKGGNGRWYLNPMWIAIGVIGIVLLILLIAFAVRGTGKTTVVER